MIPVPQTPRAWQSRVGRWMTSSKDILTLRRVLLSHTSCGHFQRFAALQGDFLENDVLFWLEVQKYKVTSRGWLPLDIR